MEAISCFQFLVDNVTTWKQSVDDLQVYAAQKHDEYAAEYVKHLDQTRPRKKKSASIASIHSDDNDEELPAVPPKDDVCTQTPAVSTLTLTSPVKAGNKLLNVQAHRKRKPGTSFKSNASGPQKFRSRKTVIIFYDSHIQSELDKLVKNFGTARNNLRRAKNAYIAARGFGLPSLKRPHHNLGHGGARTNTKYGTPLGKLTTVQMVEAVSEPVTDVAVFTQVDQEMQAVQDLCEKAAHQVIRDGECRSELESASERLQILTGMAESMLEALKKEEQRTEQEKGDDSVEFNNDVASMAPMLFQNTSLEAVAALPKLHEPQLSRLPATVMSLAPIPAAARSVPLLSDAIEVDDEEESEEEYIDIAISKYRSAHMRRLAV